ncbi:MAG: hypothetical protein ACI9IP_003004 [Arcticibacterium sp.]|jgi:hypothetical protein
MKLLHWKLLFMLFPSLSLLAQDFPATHFNSSDWSSSGAKWNEVADISVHPFEDNIEITKGQGILYANGKSMLKSKKLFTDYKLSFEILQDKENEAIFHLGNGLALDLSSDKSKFGSLIKPDGMVQRPSQQVAKMAGLWQKVNLTYSSPFNGGLAILEKVVINDVTLLTNFTLQNPSLAASSISFENSKGLLALRNAEFTVLAYKKPVSISNLRYKLQETEGNDKNWEANDTPAKMGKASTMTLDVPNDYRWFSITYSGDLEVEKADKYAFTMEYAGVANLKIDGKRVGGSENALNREPVTELVELSAGKHSFEYFYRRVWQKPAFGLYVSGADFRAYPLHPYKNLPLPEYPGVIHENPVGAKARIIRSFMNFGDEKRTTVISVGTSEKKNYSLDLDKGTLLYVWQGDFADVTDMWHNRGEPQLLKPLGQVIKLSGKPSFFQGTDDKYVFEEYFLDKMGLPTYLHGLNGLAVSQKLEPIENGFDVILSAENDNISYLLGTGNQVKKVVDKLYRIDDHYILLSQDTPLEIKKDGDLMTLSGKANAIESYQLIW